MLAKKLKTTIVALRLVRGDKYIYAKYNSKKILTSSSKSLSNSSTASASS